MKMTRKGKRLLTIALILMMLLSMLPSGVLPVHSTGVDQNGAESTDKHPDTGKMVKPLTFYFAQAFSDPTNASTGKVVASSYYPERLVITDVMVVGSTTYYRLSADKGCEWTKAGIDAGMGDGYWLDSTKVKLLVPCDTCGKLGCESSHENWCDICKIDDCTNDHITATVTDSEGREQVITVAGQLPEGAKLEVSVPEINGEKLPNVVDIKVYAPNEQGVMTEWQPTPGETIRVSIPAPAGAKKLTVAHALEDTAIIKYMLDNGLMEPTDISFAVNDERYSIYEPAVEAYQAATGTDDICILVEYFEEVSVVDGVASVDANGFSVFTSYPPNDIAENTNAFQNLPETVYVRPDEWINCTVSGFIATIFVRNDSNDIATKISGEDFAFIGEANNYVHVSASAVKDQYFEVNAFSLFPYVNHTVRFVVVDDFDYGNLYIGVVDHDQDFLDDLDEHENAKPNRYYNGSTLVTDQTIYSQSPNALINLDAVKNSNDTVFNSLQTVYGVRDPSGAKTAGFFWTETTSENEDLNPVFFGEIAEDIMAEYFALEGNENLDPNNYVLVPYTVKHETIGSNAGWYVNCKVVLKTTYLLEYEYNFPEGFDVFDITSGAKPNDTTFGTETADEDGKIYVTIGPYDPITIKTKLTNEDSSQSRDVTATLKGWSKSQNSTVAEYPVGTANYENFELSGNTTLYGVWEITSGNWEYDRFNWEIRNALVDAQNKPVSGNTVFSYEISALNAGTFPLEYELFDEFGLSLGTYSFVTNTQNQTLAFTLTGNQYIVISGIQTKTGNVYPTLTLTQTNVPAGYTCDGTTISVAVGSTNTPATGKLSSEIVNTQESYTIIYDLADSNGITGTNHAENPATYTVETGEIVLKDPTPPAGYKFVGWEEGNTIADGSVGDKTFTAVWEPALTSLTISVSGCDEAKDPEHAFIFTVTGTDGVRLRVTVIGDGEITIRGVTIGATYTVELERTWRYRCAVPTIAQEIKAESSNNSFEFEVERNNDFWLDGNDYHKGS